MIPLSLLNAAGGQWLLVELKSGESYNGYLVACDTFMNLTLREAVQTSADGQKFKKLPEVYVRGTSIKYVRVPEALLEQIREERVIKRSELERERRRVQ